MKVNVETVQRILNLINHIEKSPVAVQCRAKMINIAIINTILVDLPSVPQGQTAFSTWNNECGQRVKDLVSCINEEYLIPVEEICSLTASLYRGIYGGLDKTYFIYRTTTGQGQCLYPAEYAEAIKELNCILGGI